MRRFFDPFNPGANPIIHLDKGEPIPMVCPSCKEAWVPKPEELKKDVAVCPGCGTVLAPSEYHWEPVRGY